ncbi:MAG: LPXTG cell wall anchor domain-containing protein, partial [Nanoarchaeota archaeon]|nr:LPXTG cell wall anchor domain-containing protein [Nanoarchaeota archaeon]
PGIVSFSGFGEEETSFWDKLGEGLETIKPAVTGVRKIIQGVKKEQQPMTSTPIIPPRTPDTGLGMFAWVGLGLAVAGGAYLVLKRR